MHVCFMFSMYAYNNLLISLGICVVASTVVFVWWYYTHDDNSTKISSLDPVKLEPTVGNDKENNEKKKDPKTLLLSVLGVILFVILVTMLLFKSKSMKEKQKPSTPPTLPVRPVPSGSLDSNIPVPPENPSTPPTLPLVTTNTKMLGEVVQDGRAKNDFSGLLALAKEHTSQKPTPNNVKNIGVFDELKDYVKGKIESDSPGFLNMDSRLRSITYRYSTISHLLQTANRKNSKTKRSQFRHIGIPMNFFRTKPGRELKENLVKETELYDKMMFLTFAKSHGTLPRRGETSKSLALYIDKVLKNVTRHVEIPDKELQTLYDSSEYIRRLSPKELVEVRKRIERKEITPSPELMKHMENAETYRKYITNEKKTEEKIKKMISDDIIGELMDEFKKTAEKTHELIRKNGEDPDKLLEMTEVMRTT